MQDILSFLQSHTRDILSDVETLVRIESPSKYAEGINRVQDAAQGWLSEFGQVSRHPSGLGDTLHARVPGRAEERVVLLAHMDTVYPVGSWSNVWSVREEQAFGPGTYA
jgi:glutamate carboxypeptidase